MKCIQLLIILASLGCTCNYLFSTNACETHTGCPGSGNTRSRIRIQFIVNLLNAYPNIIHTEHVLIQPDTQSICVMLVDAPQELALVPEFSRVNFKSFVHFKRMLLANNFTVYEFLSAQRRFPPNQQVIFTHEHIRNLRSCTTATVTTILSDCFASKMLQKRWLEGPKATNIWRSNVTFPERQQKASWIDADARVGPVTLRSGRACIQALVKLLNANPALISLNRARIQSSPHFLCVIVIKNTMQLAKYLELPDVLHFSNFKLRLLAMGFTVYEYRTVYNSNLPHQRKVILTHETFRDAAQCTIESVSRVSGVHFPGRTELIDPSEVSFLDQPQDAAIRPAALQARPSSTSQATSGGPQARWAEQTEGAAQTPISGTKRRRQSVQVATSEDVGDVRHKRLRSSSLNAAREVHSSVFAAARSSCREQLDFHQSEGMELPSSIGTGTAFYYPLDASGLRSLPPSVSSYRPMECGEMALNERDRSIRSSGPQQVISGFDQSQIELASWSEIASAFDNTPNLSPSGSDCCLRECDEMSLNERLQSISNFLDL